MQFVVAEIRWVPGLRRDMKIGVYEHFHQRVVGLRDFGFDRQIYIMTRLINQSLWSDYQSAFTAEPVSLRVDLTVLRLGLCRAIFLALWIISCNESRQSDKTKQYSATDTRFHSYPLSQIAGSVLDLRNFRACKAGKCMKSGTRAQVRSSKGAKSHAVCGSRGVCRPFHGLDSATNLTRDCSLRPYPGLTPVMRFAGFVT